MYIIALFVLKLTYQDVALICDGNILILLLVKSLKLH